MFTQGNDFLEKKEKKEHFKQKINKDINLIQR
jgi:hypothetical protein